VKRGYGSQVGTVKETIIEEMLPAPFEFIIII
jgi:hypothetical protein